MHELRPLCRELPAGAITIVDKRPAIADEICNRCSVCIGACPEDALTMLRAEWEERISFLPASERYTVSSGS